MEYLVAFLTLAATVGYAVVIAVNIERGKSWAIEVARAISMLDPTSIDHLLHQKHEPVDPDPAAAGSESDRLAA